MRNHPRLAITCLTLIALALIAAVQFRYQTFNKQGWNTAVYDRWTGEMKLCGTDGCYTDDELRRIANQGGEE